MLKKVVALGLSFCMPIGLSSVTFAVGNNKPARMGYNHKLPNIIECCFEDYGVRYHIGGLNCNQLNENDFSYESLGETRITTLPNGSVRVFNPCCSVKVMLAVASLHVLGYSEEEILDFIVDLGEDLSWKKISENLINEILKNVEHENSDIATEMALRVK